MTETPAQIIKARKTIADTVGWSELIRHGTTPSSRA